MIEQVAVKLQADPRTLERDSLRLYLEKQLRLVETELFTLAYKYGVHTVTELDEMIRAGKFHEPETFEDYFRFDYLEAEREKLQGLLEEL